MASTVGESKLSLQASTVKYKWYIKKEFRDNNFELWKEKIQKILTKLKCVEELKSGSLMLARLTKDKKIDLGDKVRSFIIMCFGDKVLSEVSI